MIKEVRFYRAGREIGRSVVNVDNNGMPPHYLTVDTTSTVRGKLTLEARPDGERFSRSDEAIGGCFIYHPSDDTSNPIHRGSNGRTGVPHV